MRLNVQYCIDAVGSVSTLSRMLNVSRQTIYDWLDGSSPSDVNKTRIYNMRDALDILRSHGVNLTPRILKRLRSLDVDGATELIMVLDLECKQRALLADTLALRHNASINYDDIGIPHLD